MPRLYGDYKYQRILYYHRQGHKPPAIAKLLQEESLKCTRMGIYKFIKKYEKFGTFSVVPGAGRPTLITSEIKQLVDQRMEEDNETTATQLCEILVEKGHKMSLKTIIHGSKYCQLVHVRNEEKRLLWAKKCEEDKETFDNVIFTDETSVQLETHRRFKFRRIGSCVTLKAR